MSLARKRHIHLLRLPHCNPAGAPASVSFCCAPTTARGTWCGIGALACDGVKEATDEIFRHN